MDFRKAHAWLRGYSDALAGKEYDREVWNNYRADYVRGYESVHGSQA